MGFYEEMHKAIMFNQMHGWSISFHIISALIKDEHDAQLLYWKPEERLSRHHRVKEARRQIDGDRDDNR